MKTKQKVKLIEDLVVLVEKTLKFNDKLDDVLGIHSESAMFDLNFQLLDHSIDLVSELIGDTDEDCWLCWYIWDNSMGKNECPIFINDKEYIIDSPKKLVKLIERSKKHKVEFNIYGR